MLTPDDKELGYQNKLRISFVTKINDYVVEQDTHRV